MTGPQHIEPAKLTLATTETVGTVDGGGALQPNTPVTLPKALPTSAEQMALYEADLKENDWGHRPC